MEPERGVERLERMEREWVPAASMLLGTRRRDFLAPLWRDIGRALDPAPFDPGNPELHASRAYQEGFDWERMRRSVVAVPGYESEPVLLARLAEARWRLHDRANAIESWFALCHLAPEVFERVIEAADFPDWALRTAWRVALEQDFEPEMTREWFPAWVLLEEPGLPAALAPRRTDDDPSLAFDATMSLLAHPSLDGHAIELRRSLQAIHPVCWSDFWRRAAGHRACAAIGVEIVVGALCIATTASEYARARPTVADPNTRPSGFRHRCVPNRRCLMSPASGLMTDMSPFVRFGKPVLPGVCCRMESVRLPRSPGMAFGVAQGRSMCVWTPSTALSGPSSPGKKLGS